MYFVTHLLYININDKTYRFIIAIILCNLSLTDPTRSGRAGDANYVEPTKYKYVEITCDVSNI